MKIQSNSIAEPKPSAALISEMENYWEITLPTDYKAFLMSCNGGTPIESIFFSPLNNHEYSIDRFLCLLANVKHHPLGWYDINVVESQIGERLTDNEDLVGIDLLPIADLGFGDYLCLDFRKNRTTPTVCVWSHEESQDFAPVTYYVANSFTEFIRMLSAK